MNKALLWTFAAFSLTGCLEKKEEENMTPPAKLSPVTYKLIIAENVDNVPAPVVTVKATQCSPLYYDKKLIRVNCFFDGEWVRKDDEWKYKGNNIVFAGLVKAYYRANDQ